MHKVNLNDIDLLQFVGTQESQFLGTKDVWTDKVLDLLDKGVQNHGDLLPWNRVNEHWRLRPSEVTLWAGINGHGKSILTGMVGLWLQAETKVVIASMEMTPEQTLARMVCQASGGSQPSKVFAERFMKWQSNNLYIYDQLDSVPTERILGLCHHAATDLEAKHIFLDSLVKCGIAPDDYARQTEFVNRLTWIAKAHNIHIHLIHHVRKGKDEGDIPNKFSIKGAGELTDLVDNVVIVWRNKEKEHLMYQRSQGAEVEVDEESPDAFLCLEKQRHGTGWEGKFAFWWHHSQQYLPRKSTSPMIYKLD